MAGSSLAVVWFRRDLRLHDHPALTAAIERFERVLPLFVVDDNLVRGKGASPNRLWFMAGSVAELAASLAERGATLTVARGRPAEVVPRLAAEAGAQAIAVSRDYAPYGRQRDAKVAAEARQLGIDFIAQPGVLVHEPEDVGKADGSEYVVFSPFRRAWTALTPRPVLSPPDRIPAATGVARSTTIADLLGDVAPTADPRLMPAAGESAARRRLAAWARSAALGEYDAGRDRLDLEGTSRLSQDLRWGLLSSVEVLDWTAGLDNGRQRFASEVCWRDFYAHLLWHRPRLARQASRTELDSVAWQTDERLVRAWREGRTGYPVVDAAMRQLQASGWMHNRARMIVASFLTKHLGVDWRVGEAHFMAHLLDGDPASNNGGWQWAASTGTDAQPWFRIFNPTRQGLRHDPDAAYIRRWLPELADLRTDDPAELHQPGAYLPPIVDHATARQRALAAYQGQPAG
jgi:deoxyribodipyrimidine photo-lyase